MKNVKQILGNQKGLTLFELLIVMIFFVIIVSIALLLNKAVISGYQVTSERIDAQTQFRLIMDVLKEDVGTASHVKLLHEVPDSLDTGWQCIYVKYDSDSDVGTFYIKTKGVDGDVETAFITPYPLKKLSMTFQKGSNVNVVNVDLKAKDTNNYLGMILTQNTVIEFSGEDTETYEIISYEVIE